MDSIMTLKWNRRKEGFETWKPKFQIFKPPKIWLFRWAYHISDAQLVQDTSVNRNGRSYDLNALAQSFEEFTDSFENMLRYTGQPIEHPIERKVKGGDSKC